MATTTIKDGYAGGSDNQLHINADGSLNVTGGTGTSNVNIHDSAGNNLTSTSGSLNVNITGSGAAGTTISLYNEVTAVAMGSSTNILTYTVPAGLSLTLSRVLVSSDSIGTVEIDLNGTANSKIRLTYTQYNGSLEYSNYLLATGTVIRVVGTNNSSQGVASFNTTLQGTLA